MKLNYLLILVLLIFPLEILAQRGMIVPDSVSANFYKEVKMREQYWDTFGVYSRKGEYKQYNRWKTYWEYRINPDGTYPSGKLVLDAYKLAEKEESQMRKFRKEGFQAMPIWKELGPTSDPDGSGINSGVGRTNVIKANPNNPNELWTGAASGGVWKSTDGGKTWKVLYGTEFMSLGVSDITLAPSNPSTVYVATGDNDGSMSSMSFFSVGIIKSTDGGDTWKITGYEAQLNEGKIVTRIWVSPTNENIVIAATNTGIYKSTDGGDSWNLTSEPAYFCDLEQMPGNPAILYASTMLKAIGGTTYIYKSIDTGNTWSVIKTFQGACRTCIEVTPASPNSLYALTANNTFGFHSVVISTNQGSTFENTNLFSIKGMNYLGWYQLPNTYDGTRGQGHYDLCMAVSPTNANTIFIGGINIWKSTDKGKNFSMAAHWRGDYSVPYVHADHHDLRFVGNTLYAAHDGGIDITTNLGSSWTSIHNGIGIGQIYKFSNSNQHPDWMIIGCQDLGTRIHKTNWTHLAGGDGMGCKFDPTNDSIYYSSVYYGYITRYYKGTETDIIDPWTTLQLFGVKDTSTWVTNFDVSRQHPNRIYVGYSNIYYSDDYGTNWKKQTQNTPNANSTIRNVMIAPSNDNYIYAHTLNGILYTKNAGSNWNYLDMPAQGLTISYIKVHPTNPEIIYLTASGYNAKNKVFKYENNVWTNLTGNLPNVSVNCVELDIQNDIYNVYVGTDIGVYYASGDSPYYVRWGEGLPNVCINEMEIIPAKNALRAATYGRGVWEVATNTCSVQKIEIEAQTETTICQGDSVLLSVKTADENDILWNTGQTGKEIWVKEAGDYYAVSNPNSDCYKTSNFINISVNNLRTLNVNIKGSTAFCYGDSVILTAAKSGFNENSFKWNTGETTNVIVVKEPGEYFVSAIATSSNCKSTSDMIIVNTYEKPNTPVVTFTEGEYDEETYYIDTLATDDIPNARYQWYKDDIAIKGETNNQLLIKRSSDNDGDYSVTISNEGDCWSDKSNPYNYVDIEDDELLNDFDISPLPANNSVNIMLLNSNYDDNYDITILDLQGKTLLQKNNTKLISNNSITLDITSLPSGSYILRLKNSKQTFNKTIIKN